MLGTGELLTFNTSWAGAMVKTALAELSDEELSSLWRTEQVLHAVARVMLQGKLDEDVLGFARLAVCECAEKVQALAGRVQRERLTDG